MKPYLIALAFCAVSASAVAAPAAPAEKPWVTASNAHTLEVLKAQAVFEPEGASGAGLSQYDGLAIDIGPDINARSIAASEKLLAQLRQKLAAEKDGNVRQDLQILISSIEDDIVGTRLSEKYNLPWFDVPQFVFGNIQSLLDKQIPEARRGKALELLQRYTSFTRAAPRSSNRPRRVTRRNWRRRACSAR